MKNLIFGALFVVCAILSSCGSNTQDKVHEDPTLLEPPPKVESSVSETTPSVDTVKPKEKPKAPKCTEVDKSSGDQCFGLIKTSIYKDYKLVLNISRMPVSCMQVGFDFTAYKSEKGKFVKIKTETIFNKDRDKLLKKINALFVTEYESVLSQTDEYFTKCMPKSISKIKFEDLGVLFCEKNVSFFIQIPSIQETDCQESGHLGFVMDIKMKYSEIEAFLED